MSLRPIILTLLLAVPAWAQTTTSPATLPTTLPTKNATPAVAATTSPTEMPALKTLIEQLGDRYPAVRQQARETLMLLPANRLGEIAEAARGIKLNANARSTLRECVAQIYMASKESYTGTGRGYMGVSMQPEREVNDAFPLDVPGAPVNAQGDAAGVAAGGDAPGDAPADNGNAGANATPIRRGVAIQSVSLGHDSYRVLQAGDVITAISVDGSTFVPVIDFSNLSGVLLQRRAGDWITVRIIRGGSEREAHVRLAGSAPASPQSPLTQQKMAEADEYWRKEFLPRLQ